MKRNQQDYWDYEYTGIKDRRKMSMENRAAQFNAFDALTGFGGIISEASFVPDERIELSAQQQEEINSQLLTLKKKDTVRVMYFNESRYDDVEGTYKGYDQINKKIMVDSLKIAMDDVIWLKKKDS